MEDNNYRPGIDNDEEEKEGMLTRIMKCLRRNLIRIIVWTVIVIIVIYLTLFLSSKIGEFESISDMMRFIRSQFR